MTKRGSSHYLNSWNPNAKKYIFTCTRCGHEGFNPEILNDEFASGLMNQAIQKELTKTLDPLHLDEHGRCEICSEIEDEQINP
jgi:hypothetical protein